MESIYTCCRKKNVHHLSWIWAVLLAAMVFFLSWFSKHRFFTLPPALTVNNLPQHNQSFIAERAWHNLKTLTSFGTRPTGSHANEILSVDFFKRELLHIERSAHPNQKIYSDIQVTSGSFFYIKTRIYRNVQNIIVRLAGSDEAENSLRKNHTLMLNCHFDSVAGSPGASDDAASCCVMLETLRVLSQQEKRLRHSVIFLFNGAEERGLHASHGFITQHRWAKDIRAFLNLESVGSNGKEFLFQSGPNHGWLIDMYKNAAVHPNSQVAGEEMFQLGVIPSDTDFRIFRDYGHIPGMDFAYSFNGYRYHTKYDHIDYLQPEVLQRTGDNILSLVRRLANSNELTNTEAYVNDRMVYFDLLGYTFISYTESTGQILHIIIPLLSVILSYYFLRIKDISRFYVIKEICFGVLATIFSFILGFLVCYLIATELDLNGKTMSWYNRTYFSVALYSFPTLAIASAFYAQLVRMRDSPLSLALQTQARLNGVNLVWAVITIILTLFGFRSAYVPMIPVLVTLVVNTIIGLTKSQNTIRRWLFIHLAGQVLVVLWATHIYHPLIAVFIPTAGRSGSDINPDIPIGFLTCFFTMFIGSYLIPLVGLLRSPKSFLIIVAGLFVLTRLSFIVTHIGFPYSDDSVNPTPQRHFITHALRKEYDLNGLVKYTDSGYWFEDLDRNTEETIKNLVAPEKPVRQENLFCGIPTYPCSLFYTDGFWLPGPGPIVEHDVQVNATKPLKISDNKWQLQVTLNGSYLYQLQIRPKNDVTLSKWNLLDFIPEKTGHEGYFTEVTHGLEAPPFELKMEFDTKIGHTGPLVDVSVLTFHWQTSFKPTPAFTDLLARVPKWAYYAPSVKSLQTHVY